jgi:hypothetical protein
VNRALTEKLAELRADYEKVVGQPFEHFYCPILFRDDHTPLCRAHIINAAFRDSARRWTVQRKDVDGFYGAFLESEFLAIQERGKHDPVDVLINKQLAHRLQPKIALSGREVGHYFPKGRVPAAFSEVTVKREGKPTVRLALKLHPSEMLAALQVNCQIMIERDVRIAALGSLLKAAHLTLFDMLGYQYALSAGGYFVGHDIIGEFFRNSVGKAKATIQKNADRHFRQFVNLVRPVVSAPDALKGTTSDGLIYLCIGASGPWALLTLIRTGKSLHAVVVPALENAEVAARFVAFLTEPPPRFEGRLARFVNDQWEVSKAPTTFVWPAANFA